MSPNRKSGSPRPCVQGAADVEVLLRKVVESTALQGSGGAVRTTFGMLVDAPDQAFRDEVAFCGEDWRS